MWGKDALEEARLDFLGEEGREAWNMVMSLRKDLNEAKEFSASFQLPPDASEEEDVAMGELEIAMHKRIQKLTQEYKDASKKLQPHLKKQDASWITCAARLQRSTSMISCEMIFR